jgi:multiple sugar transport system substrate-binding protein
VSQRLTRRVVVRRCAGGALGIIGSALLAACGGTAATTIGSTSVAATASVNTATAAPTSVAAATTGSTAAATSSSASTAAATTTTAAKASSASASAAAIAPPTSANTIWWFATNGLAKTEEDGWKGVFAQFEKENPTLKIQFTNGDNTGYIAAVAGGTYPDVHEPETKELPSWAYKQVDIDMTSYVQKAKVDQSAYSATQLQKVILNGKWYAIPWDTAPAVIFYNKTLFRNSGVAEPPKKWGDPSWTWDTFLEAAKRLTTGSGDSATFGWGWTTSWYYYNPWAWANGGEFSNKERTQITATDGAYSDAFQWYADLINVHQVAPTAAQAKQATWSNGKVAMMSSGSYTTVGMDQVMKSSDWDVAPYPVGKAGVFTRAPADCCAMVNHAPHPDNGLTAILFITGPTGQKMLAQLGYVPTLKSAQQSPDFLQPTGHVDRQVFIDGLQISRPTPIPFIYTDVAADFSKQIPNLLAAKITAKSMMEQLQPQLQALLDKAPPDWRLVD